MKLRGRRGEIIKGFKWWFIEFGFYFRNGGERVNI